MTEITDDTPISDLKFRQEKISGTIIRNALKASGIITVGQVKAESSENLLKIPNFSKIRLQNLYEAMGMASKVTRNSNFRNRMYRAIEISDEISRLEKELKSLGIEL